MRFRLLAILLTAGSVHACASLHEEPSQTEHISVDSAADFKPAEYVSATGLGDYQTGVTKAKGEWISCRLKNARATVLLMHGDHQGYDPVRFCHGWHAQAFLASGYDVVTINRPGFGASSGAADFTGERSIAAVLAVLPVAIKTASLPHPVTGVWGYGSAATAAAIVSKHLKGLNFMILGGGIYDYEEALRTSTDPATKADIESIKALGGDKAIEERSVAYETTGLPPTIAIYHGAKDTVAPVAQAKAFVDALASSGHYKTSYQPLDGQGHDLPWVYHRHVLEAIIQSQNPKD